MKVFFSFIILAILACARTEKQSPSFFGAISSTIKYKLLKIRDEMPNGFPKYGIPSLAPLTIEQKQISEVKDNVKVDAALADLIVTGLNNFEIANIKFSPLSNKLDLTLLFKNITLDTQYDLNLWGENNGLSVELIGQGPALVSVCDLNVKIAAKLNINLLSMKFKLKTLDLAVKLGSITSDIRGILGNGDINKQLNHFISTEFVEIMNNNVDIITAIISADMLDRVNDFLNTSSTGKFLLVEVFDDVPKEN